MLFNPSQAYMPNRHRQRTALRTFFPSSSFSPPDSKEPLRRGILFSSVAAVLLLIGAILTWLGFNDVFGGKISMTGPLLIALALLMLLLSFRQFMLARKRNRSTNGPLQMEAMNSSAVTAVIVDHDEGAATIVVETWDSEQPHNDTISYRNNHDLAPPSYMDIAQSCSSNCPSLISHEDHNEAPPTYEETCGLYNSETSLTNACSRRSSSQFEESISSRRTSHSGQGLSQNNHTFCHPDMITELDKHNRSVNVFCPRTNNATTVHSNRGQPSPTSMENNLLLIQSSANPHFPMDAFGHLISVPQNNPETSFVASSNESCETRSKLPEWSRRSFSSIPSYTCLLSESGEVSSHVFDTSSIIEEILPLLAGHSKAQESASRNSLVSPATTPTRCHSLSSVNTLRLGVPYSTQTSLLSNSMTPGIVTQPDQLNSDRQLSSDVLTPGYVNHASKNVEICRSTSFPLQDVRQGSEPLLVDLAAGQSQVNEYEVPQPTRTSPLTSAWHTSHARDMEEPGELSPLLGATVSKTRRKSESCLTASRNNSSMQGKMPNTQDVQETI